MTAAETAKQAELEASAIHQAECIVDLIEAGLATPEEIRHAWERWKHDHGVVIET